VLVALVLLAPVLLPLLTAAIYLVAGIMAAAVPGPMRRREGTC